MKKIFVLIAVCLAMAGAMAQPGHHGRAPRPQVYSVSFQSQHGESFNVFVDGELMNRMPQSRVMVSDVTDRTHEVVVILKRPVQKAAVLQLLPGEPSVVVNVNYDERTESLSLYTPSHNRADGRQVNYVPAPAPQRMAPVPPASEPPMEPEVRRATEEDVAAMVVRMKNQSFDSDRLALGKVIVASSNLTAAQIARLAETIDFSSSQVEFLKYAYNYCIDKPNYYTTVDVLTFSSDKKKVLDYIATQK
ncbi:MAG: DUF4476 domain-containing protein [Bacteroidales bacterium]|nr:DUF4476 domain-containing protein [Bacteroidales bacterium]